MLLPKIKVYVKTVEVSVLDFSNVLTLGHTCDSPEERISSSMQHMPRDLSGSISDEERKAIDLVEQFSKENGLDYEIIDLTKAGRMTQLNFIMKGWKVPVISIGNETITRLPTKEELASLLRRQNMC